MNMLMRKAWDLFPSLLGCFILTSSVVDLLPLVLPGLFQITIYKDDECVLANNSHRAKWKVISPAGNEAMVPSVCFTVPPPNKEAMETAARWDRAPVVDTQFWESG